MYPKTHAVLQLAIEQGVAYGINRAYKHLDGTPPTEQQQEIIVTQVMNVIYEWFHIPGDEV